RRRRRRPGAGAVGRAAAREAARAPLLPHHADLPPARPARAPALSGPLRDRVRRAVPVLRRVPARSARGPARRPVHDRAGAPPHPGDGRRARARAARREAVMRRVLVTHVESAVGRRVVKALYHDPEVALVLALGTEAEPTFLAAYRDKVAYQRLDLAKARHLQ